MIEPLLKNKHCRAVIPWHWEWYCKHERKVFIWEGEEDPVGGCHTESDNDISSGVLKKSLAWQLAEALGLIVISSPTRQPAQRFAVPPRMHGV